MFPFIFFSVQYLSFCLRLWNLALEILDLVMFLFHLLCEKPFGCFRLRNLAPETLGLVLFHFDLVSAKPFCCLLLWNFPCETLGLVLFLFDLLCSQSFSCFRLWNFPCEILVLVLFFFRSSLCDIFLFSWVVKPCLWNVFEMSVLFSFVSSKLSDVSGMCLFSSAVSF